MNPLNLPEKELGKDVAYLYIVDYYDGPLSGVVISDGGFYYFLLLYDEYSKYDSRTSPSHNGHRIYAAYEMPESWWDTELNNHRLWNWYVGNSIDLPKTYKSNGTFQDYQNHMAYTLLDDHTIDSSLDEKIMSLGGEIKFLFKE
jgi:hypothetical protein